MQYAPTSNGNVTEQEYPSRFTEKKKKSLISCHWSEIHVRCKIKICMRHVRSLINDPFNLHKHAFST